MTPELALQAWITGVLTADPTVSGLIGANVFDEAPQGQPAPYAYFGAVNRRRREEAMHAWTITVRMYAVTDEVGRAKAWEIANAMTDGLDGLEPMLEAPFVGADVIRAIQAGDVIEAGSEKSVFVDLQTTILKP